MKSTSHYSWTHWVYWLVIVALLIEFLLLGWSGLWSWHSWQAAKKGAFSAANVAANRAKPTVTFLSETQGWLIPEFTTWLEGLRLLDSGTNLALLSQEYAQGWSNSDTDTLSRLAPTIRLELRRLRDASLELQRTFNHFTVIKPLLGQRRIKHVQQLITAIADGSTVADTLLEGNHTMVLLLQNSNELRATGGFAGSFLYVELSDGVIKVLEIRDIYQPDGQFTGYVAAPPGIAEYLSSGQGLRLPDANWHADFPTSAQIISGYFAQGQYQGLDIIAAINLPLMQQLLNVLGTIQLHDYNQVVTADNFAELARADRDTFFPGSYQKPQFLQAVLTQLKFKLKELSKEQQMQLVGLLRNAVVKKDLQLFFIQPSLQTIVEKYQAAGQLDTQGTMLCPWCQTEAATPVFLQLVESNVGINKSNEFIKREVAIDLHQQVLKVRVRFENTAAPSTTTQDREKSYLNYQRILVPVEAQLGMVLVDSQKPTQVDNDVITLASGKTVRQIGWLVTAVPGLETETEITLTLPTLNPETAGLITGHQSGLGPTNYYLNWDGQTASWLQESDTFTSREMIQSSRDDRFLF